MNIGLNLFLTSPKSITGAFVYIENILPAIFKADKENNYFILGDQDVIRYFKKQYKEYSNVYYQIFDIKRDIFINPIRAVRKIYAKVNHNYSLREKIISQEVRTFFQKNNISLYFSPSPAIFPNDIPDVKVITTILDLQQDFFPENFSPAYLKRRINDCRFVVERSDRIIAISDYTKKTTIERYHASPEKIQTIYFAQQEFKDGLSDIKLPDEYVFYPAALWPHKNHHVLIKALAILKDRFPNLKAICAGVTKNEKLKNELETLSKSLGVEDRINFSGYVFGPNLKSLYTHAKALVFPSAFEGFGIPLVEAFCMGLPVIAADNSSITEVVDGAGILVPTGDEKALADAISQVLSNDQIRQDLINRGYQRAKLFSWEKAANETISIFNSL
jgi:glycosyltransferase involved in cell wall biosynthesis